MADPIDDLVQRWKVSPSPTATAALCDALRGSARAALVQQVGEFSMQRHAGDVSVMLAVARMYLDGSRLSDAQGALVNAGKVAPRDPDVYRWLGEVLLRRGDAERAEKVLERAVQLGTREPEARLWLERARVFRPMQAKAGTRAVAAEVAQAASVKSEPPPRGAMDSYSDTTTMVRHMPPAGHVPALDGASAAAPPRGQALDESQAAYRSDGKASAGVPRAAAVHQAAPAEAGLEDLAQTDVRPHARALSTAFPAEDLSDSDMDTAVLEVQRAPATGPARRPPAASSKLFPPDADTAPAFSPVSPKPFPRPPSLDLHVSVQAPIPQEPPKPTPSRRPAAPPPPSMFDPPPAAPTFSPDELPSAADGSSSIPGNGRNPYASPAREAEPAPKPPMGGPAAPHPRDVLDALSLAGVFEPPLNTTAVARWDAPPKPARRGWRAPVFVSMLTLALAGGGVATFKYVQKQRAAQHAQSESLLATVESELRDGKPAVIPDIEASLKRAFMLDSRSPRAWIDWLHERALYGLLKGGADVSFEEAMTRGRDVGVQDVDMAFALVASFVFQGDLGGAAALFPKWDAPAGKDPWYELVAGATLERAGDPRARERYAASAQLDPQLLVSQIAQARAEAIDGDPQRAGELAKQFRAAHPGRAEGAALVALAWARDLGRSDQPPPEADEVVTRAAELPVTLAAVPDAITAIRAIDKRAPDEAKAAIPKALALADGPGIATWIGTIALATGDEALARKAALAAVGFSAVYPPARILAARVALLGARLDEALKATEDLDPSSPDVAVVRSASSYERLDGDGLRRALDALSSDAKKLPFLTALVMSPDVLDGRAQVSSPKLLLMADDDAPWSDLIAMDLALDVGDLATADKIVAKMGRHLPGDALARAAPREARALREAARRRRRPQ